MNTGRATSVELKAHSALLNGWAVVPLQPRGKTPLTAHGCKDASRSHEKVTEWWTRHPDANIGIATGTASGLLVIDVDGEDGEDALAAFGDLPDTVEVHTGKGRHLYYQLPQGVTLGNSARRLGPQLDTRGNGGYVVAPPSIHPNGHTYTWAIGRSPDDMEVAKLPAAIVRSLHTVPASARAHVPPTSLTSPTRADRASLVLFRAWFRTVACGLLEGQGRNQTAYRIACRALEAMPLADVRDIVHAWNASNCPPLGDREFTACINSAAGVRATRAAA